eukprot:scpid56498/ scgid31837/ 
MVHLSVCFQTKYSLIVLVTTLVVITTEVWCLTPRCFPKAHHPYTDEGRNEGFETFKWYTPGTLSNFYLGHNRVYSTYFEFQGSCTIKAIAISFTAHGNCRFSVSSKSFDHNGWSNERSVRFSNLSTFGSRHNIYLSEQSSHGLLIKFTVRSDRTRPLSQCTFQLNEAREPYIALHVQEALSPGPTASPTTASERTDTTPATTSSEAREKFTSHPSWPPTEYASNRTTHLITSSAPLNVTSPIAIPATTQSDTMMPGSNTSSSSVTILVSLLVIGLMLMTLLLAVGLWKRRQIAKFFHRNEITARPATTSEGQVAVSARFRADREEMQLSHQPSNPVTNEYTVAVVGAPHEYATVPERDGHSGEQMYSEATAPSNIPIVRSGHRIPPDITNAERYTQPEIQRSVVNSANLPSQYAYIESSSRVLSATSPRVHDTPGPAPPPSLPNDTYSVPHSHSQPVSNPSSSRRVVMPSDYLEPSDSNTAASSNAKVHNGGPTP